MPRITVIEAMTARARIKSRNPHNAERAPLRDAIARMTTERMLEFELDAGESLRKLKLDVRRAAREVGRDIEQGESESGSLLVWLGTPAKARAPRKARSGASE
jgi:hypothetical protein